MLILLMALFASSSFAEPAVDPSYYTITGVSHKILISEKKNFSSDDGGGQLAKVQQAIQTGVGGDGPSAGGLVPPAGTVPKPNTVPATIMPPMSGVNSTGYTPTGVNPALDQLNAFLDSFNRIWAIVEKNKPVVTIDSTKFACALPELVKNRWDECGGFMPERNITYKTTYTNGWGWEVVSLEYQVKLLYGGNIKGKGLYIASARIIPTKVHVLWGYTLNALVTAPNVFNVRTPENPLAAIQLNVLYTISTVLSSDTTTDTFEVHGDGKILDTKSGTTLAPSVLRLTIR